MFEQVQNIYVSDSETKQYETKVWKLSVNCQRILKEHNLLLSTLQNNIF
jgi:hypothetical protein